MMPFAKNRDDGVGGGPAETKTREPDDFSLIDAIANDMMEAFQSRDAQRLKAALEALVSHIRDTDDDQSNIFGD